MVADGAQVDRIDKLLDSPIGGGHDETMSGDFTPKLAGHPNGE